jgi:hypothetical protein
MSKKKTVSEKKAQKLNLKPYLWQIVSCFLVLAVLVLGVILVTQLNADDCNTNVLDTESETIITNLKIDQAKVNDTITFLKETFALSDVSVTDTTIEDGLYKITIAIEGQEMPIYSTFSGDNLIIPGMGILNKKEALEQKEVQEQENVQEAIPKTEKPVVEVFVMSHCPYGTQIEKGLIPVYDLLKEDADIQVKFADYAMHGEVEVVEQLNQYCIEKELGKDKYFEYLSCFLEDGKTQECFDRVGITEDQIGSCISSADQEFDITKNLNDQSTWKGSFPTFNVFLSEVNKYGVQGSPTTVINGVVVKNMSRSPQGILDAICDSFTEQPSVCSTELSTETPAAGFGFEGTSSSSAATCG